MKQELNDYNTIEDMKNYFEISEDTLLNREKRGLKATRWSNKLKFYRKKNIDEFFNYLDKRKEW